MTKFFAEFFTALFDISWVAGILAWLYGMYELIAVMRLKQSSYRIGKKVFDFTEPLEYRQDIVRLNEIVKTEKGKYKFIELDTCVFRETWKPAHLLRFHTPFPVKGTLRFINGKASVEGRIPLGASALVIAWLLSWTSSGMNIGLQDGNYSFAVLYTLIGWAFVAAMYFVALPMEKRRFLIVYAQLKQQITRVQ